METRLSMDWIRPRTESEGNVVARVPKAACRAPTNSGGRLSNVSGRGESVDSSEGSRPSWEKEGGEAIWSSVRVSSTRDISSREQLGGLGLPDGYFSLAKPVAMGGRLSTAGADFVSDGPKVVFKVSEVGAGFEVVAPSIGDYAGVRDVDLAHAPAVEACFMEEVAEDAVGTDLDVAGTGAEASHAEVTRNGTSVGGMGEPKNGGGSFVVQAGDDARLQALVGSSAGQAPRAPRPKAPLEGARARARARVYTGPRDPRGRGQRSPQSARSSTSRSTS